MSATIPPVATTPASNAVAIAKGGAQLVSLVQTADPALYAQLVGSVTTYAKSAGAPLVGAAVGLLVAKLGVASIVTPDLQALLTDALMAVGTAAGAAAMHWLSKAPGRALQAAPSPVTPVGPNPANQGPTQ